MIIFMFLYILKTITICTDTGIQTSDTSCWVTEHLSTHYTAIKLVSLYILVLGESHIFMKSSKKYKINFSNYTLLLGYLLFLPHYYHVDTILILCCNV